MKEKGLRGYFWPSGDGYRLVEDVEVTDDGMFGLVLSKATFTPEEAQKLTDYFNRGFVPTAYERVQKPLVGYAGNHRDFWNEANRIKNESQENR